MDLGRRGICATPEVNDPKVIQEAWANTRLQKPGIVEAVRQMNLSKGTGIEGVGDQNVFWVYNIQKRVYDTVRAELKWIGTMSTIWVALSEWQNGHVTGAEVDAMATALERSTRPGSLDSTKGILSIDRQVYGDPPNINPGYQKGAGDGKTTFLICDIQDGFTGSNSFVAGFFFSVDVDPASGAVATSNKRDLLYIDSYPGIYFNGNRRTSLVLSTLSHEFQHLIHWNYDPFEVSFFNEGLSEYAEYLCGFTLRSPAGYLTNTGVTLTGWDGKLEDYSRAALWTKFVAEQYGTTFLRNLTQNKSTGIQGFDAALSQSGSPSSFAATLLNFFTANWLGSSGQDPSMRYKSGLNMRPTVRGDYTDPNVRRPDTLLQQAVQYVSFASARNFRITFTLPANITVRAVESGATALRVRNVSGGVEFSSAELGTTYSSVVFVVMNTHPVLPAFYSYAASGELMHFIVEEGYDSGIPHEFSQGNAPYLGFGNNSATLGMAVRFQPAVSGNVLRKARMMLAFNQEFSNGTALPTDKMNFVFHIWGDRNGRPGQDLIAPFLVSVNRSVNAFGTFIDIDLSAYERTLTNVAGPVYLGFMEDVNDSVGTYGAVDNYATGDYSYVFRGPNYLRAPNTWETMKEVSAVNNNMLDGFNLMFRGIFEYSDSSAAPPLTLGYLQNPLLSEYIDVVAASSVELRGTSVGGTITQSGVSSPLQFSGIPGTTKAYIDTTQKLKASGSVSLRAKAAKKFGVYATDTTVTFNARLLKSDEPAIVNSPSGDLTVAFESGSVGKAVFVTAADGTAGFQGSVANSALAQKLFSLGPPGLPLSRDATLTVPAGPGGEDLTVAMLREGAWRSVPTTHFPTAGELKATIRQLGLIGVVRKSDVSGELERVPSQFALAQNYPNPFNPSTTIEFAIARPSNVRLIVYDMLGREIARLVDGERNAGRYSVHFDASEISSGVYLYRLSAGDFSQVRKFMVVK